MSSKTNNYLLNKVALKNMQKLHLWFARRRKNHTHSLRSKWLNHIFNLSASNARVSSFDSAADFSQSLNAKTALHRPTTLSTAAGSKQRQSTAP